MNETARMEFVELGIGIPSKESNFDRVETGNSNVLIRRKQLFIYNRIKNYLIYHHAKIEKSQIR